MPELDLGNVKGPQGKSAYQSALDAGYSGSEEAFNTAMAKAPDAVLYTAQNLTDEQKAQARGNINAAPGGFGLGETPKYIADANDAVKNGRYAVDKSTLNLPGPIGDLWNYTYLDVYTGNRPDVYIKQTMTSPYQNWHQCEVTRCFYNGRGEWQPWEWVNPPMLLGVEYRTTERYLGKPVYVQVVDFGRLPNTAAAGKSIPNMDNVDKTIRWSGLTSDGYSLPGGNLYTSWDEIAVRIVRNRIDVKTTTDESAYTATFTLWYTKTTD